MSKISNEERQIISRILQKHVPGVEVRIFGSRFKETSWFYSDLDVVIVAEGPLDNVVLAELACDFEESNLPYRVDILDWHRLGEEFRALIEKQGYEIFSKG